MTILNTWTSTVDNLKWYVVGKPDYKNDEYYIYKLNPKGYLYTFKNVAIACLIGKNKNLLDCFIVNKQDVPLNYMFTFNRMRETKQKAELLMPSITY